MIGQEILRLPEIPEGTPEAQLRAIRSYLYRLAEQLQYLLSTEQEARIRGQEVCSQEAFRGIQQKILDSLSGQDSETACARRAEVEQELAFIESALGRCRKEC